MKKNIFFIIIIPENKGKNVFMHVMMLDELFSSSQMFSIFTFKHWITN